LRRWVEYARKIGGSGKQVATVAEYEEAGGDELEFETEDMDDDDDVEAEGKRHKKHKKGKKKHRKASKEWFTFVKRAFVGTMDPKEIKEVFGREAPMVSEAQEEVTEL
jgi:endopolyphosphatase